MSLPSAGKWDRIERCPASGALPRADSSGEPADRGQWLHHFATRAASTGDATLDDIPPEYREEADRINIGQLLDLFPSAPLAERSYAYDPFTDKARFLGAHLSGDLPDLGPTEIHTALDLCDPESGIEVDLKTGTSCGLAMHHAQTKIHTLSLSRGHGRESSTGILAYLNDDGSWTIGDDDRVVLGPSELAANAKYIRAKSEKVIAARETFATGKIVQVNAGPWCYFCPSIAYCPPHVATAQSLVPLLTKIQTDTRAKAPSVTQERLGEMWEQLDVAENVLKKARKQLATFAHVAPFPTPRGGLVCEVPQERVAWTPTGEYKMVAKEVGIPKP